jgi:hypothetical protein
MALTRGEIVSLASEVKRIRGRCLQRAVVFDKWLEKNPNVDRQEARCLMMAIGDSPFPPIHTHKCDDKRFPYHDARFDTIWKNDDA